MMMRSWIRHLFARSVTRPIRKAPHRFRPALEVLAMSLTAIFFFRR